MLNFDAQAAPLHREPSGIVVLSNVAPETFALLKSAPARLAFCSWAPCRFEFERSAPCRFAPERSDVDRFASEISAPCIALPFICEDWKLAPLKFAFCAFTLPRFAPWKFAPLSEAPTRVAFDRFAFTKRPPSSVVPRALILAILAPLNVPPGRDSPLIERRERFFPLACTPAITLLRNCVDTAFDLQQEVKIFFKFTVPCAL